jgi:hypothetical protein
MTHIAADLAAANLIARFAVGTGADTHATNRIQDIANDEVEVAELMPVPLLEQGWMPPLFNGMTTR